MRRPREGQVTRSPTAQELAVLELVVLGFTNAAIGTRLGISEQTVKAHVSALFGKLGARNRAALAARAVARGLVRPSSAHSR